VRATEQAERKIEMFLSGLAVKGNLAVSSMIRTHLLRECRFSNHDSSVDPLTHPTGLAYKLID
jgi:hypothetical protein